jgi:hypothetical protein
MFPRDKSPAKMRIMVVDDEVELCALLGTVLEETGCRVRTTSGVDEATALIPVMCIFTRYHYCRSKTSIFGGNICHFY